MTHFLKLNQLDDADMKLEVDSAEFVSYGAGEDGGVMRIKRPQAPGVNRLESTDDEDLHRYCTEPRSERFRLTPVAPRA